MADTTPVDYSDSFLKNALKCEIMQKLVNQKANACPMAMRVAWHSAGTYDAKDSSGGSNGATMRFEPEKSDGANAGLHIIHDLLKPVKAAFPTVSVADIWAFAGACAVEFAGGPKVPFNLGRTDDKDASNVPPNGRLPDASQGAAHLREVFGRMGFNDQEIVALSGGHTLGRCHKVRSGFDGAWTPDPLKFDNSYYVNLMNLEWTKREWDGKEQYTDPTGRYIMLPTDIAIKTDPQFRIHTERYAKDQDVFFTEFAAAYGKLLAAGCPAACQGMAAVAAKASVDSNADFREHCMHGSLEHAQSAVKAGADVNGVENISGRNALMKAVFWGHIHMMPYLLEELKMDPNVQDYNGDTAAHDAARFGHVDIMKALVAAKADISIKNKDGATVADIAKAYEQPAITSMM